MQTGCGVDVFNILVESNSILFINIIPKISIKEYYLSQKLLGIYRSYHCMNHLYMNEENFH